MNYEKIYNQIIEHAQNRKLEGYKEKHHIVPKCLGGSNEKENLVELTAKEHFLCHKLLCEIYPSNPKLMWALWLMAIGKQKRKIIEPYKVSSREYERLKIIFIKQSKLKKITDVHKKQVSKANSKKVLQYDFQGNLINIFSSAVEAERYINNKPNEHWVNLKNNIDACCRLKQKSAYGYIWKYEGDILNLEKYAGSLNKIKGRKIIYIKTGEIFSNVKETTSKLNISNWMFYKMIEENKLKYDN
jgi:hypothetical protein